MQSSLTTAHNFQNIIDLSRTKRSAYRPKNSGELVVPTSFYKLHTSDNVKAASSAAESIQDLISGSGQTVFLPYYELPSIDVINEWVIVLESLLNEVYSVQGCEAVLLEALT